MADGLVVSGAASFFVRSSFFWRCPEKTALFERTLFLVHFLIFCPIGARFVVVLVSFSIIVQLFFIEILALVVILNAFWR